MTNDKIEQYIEKRQKKNVPVHIHFKERSTVTGLFIQERDYEELKSKNFWRVVNHEKLKEWQKTKDINLSRVFNGLSFTRLSDEDNG